MSQPPKERIRDAFERAAHTYDSAAQVQRRVCDQLASDLPADWHPDRILDAGCGTGYALGLLHRLFPAAGLLALDLSPAMLRQITFPAERLAGDLEHLPLASGSIDLYWSSLALQWCDLAIALAEARRILRENGRLAVATLGPETFKEVRAAFAVADTYRHTLTFHTQERVSDLTAIAGFRDSDIQCRRQVSHYPDLKTLLGAVKAIGANQIGTGRRTGLMSRTAWQRAESAYEALRQPEGLPLTYDIITIHARK